MWAAGGPHELIWRGVLVPLALCLAPAKIAANTPHCVIPPHLLLHIPPTAGLGSQGHSPHACLKPSSCPALGQSLPRLSRHPRTRVQYLFRGKTRGRPWERAEAGGFGSGTFPWSVLASILKGPRVDGNPRRCFQDRLQPECCGVGEPASLMGSEWEVLIGHER